MPGFEYHRPRSLPEAIDALEKPGAKLIAGGTDLIPRLKKGLLKLSSVVDISRLSELARIEADSEFLHIGPLATHSQLAKSKVIKEFAPVLSESALTMAGPQIRNMGTIGGNICNASPAGDLLPGLLVLNAVFKLASRKGERKIPANEFFTGPGETVLQPWELLTDILIPLPQPENSAAVYFKLGRRNAMEIAQVGVACWMRFNGRIEEVRLALGAVAPTPIRAVEAEKILRGSTGEDAAIAEAAAAAREACKPIDDVRTTAEYRREMVEVLTRRAVISAMKGARK